MTGSHPVRSSAERAAHGADSAGRDVVDSTLFGALVTGGLVAYGVVHLLVAWIIAQIAWSDTGTKASQNGAFREMASNPVGVVLLWVTAIGLFLLVLWQLSLAILGHRDLREMRSRVVARLGSAGRAIVYAALGVGAVTAAVGSASGDDSQKAWTAQLMSAPLGRVLVAIVGVCIIAVAATMAYRGFKKKFTDKLSGPIADGLLRLGQIGHLTKGFAFGIIGVLFIVAAVTYDSQKAGGMDSAIRTLREQPLGRYLLTVVALGIACFGLYCFAWSRHAKRA